MKYLTCMAIIIALCLQVVNSFHRIAALRCNRLHRSIQTRAAQPDDDEEPIPPPPPRQGGTGEWADWDVQVFDDDEFDEDDAVFPSSMLSSMAAAAASATTAPSKKATETPSDEKKEDSGKKEVYVRIDSEWEGWSEEPPFFDEDDIEEVEDPFFRDTDPNAPKAQFKFKDDLFNVKYVSPALAKSEPAPDTITAAASVSTPEPEAPAEQKSSVTTGSAPESPSSETSASTNTVVGNMIDTQQSTRMADTQYRSLGGLTAVDDSRYLERQISDVKVIVSVLAATSLINTGILLALLGSK